MFEMFEVRTQKSPQGFHLAGSQDFDDGSGNHQPRILVELAESEQSTQSFEISCFFSIQLWFVYLNVYQLLDLIR